jgi:hypothetical protein
MLGLMFFTTTKDSLASTGWVVNKQMADKHKKRLAALMWEWGSKGFRREKREEKEVEDSIALQGFRREKREEKEVEDSIAFEKKKRWRIA